MGLLDDIKADWSRYANRWHTPEEAEAELAGVKNAKEPETEAPAMVATHTDPEEIPMATEASATLVVADAPKTAAPLKPSVPEKGPPPPATEGV